MGVCAANALLHRAAAGVWQQAVGDAHDLHRQLPAGCHYDHLQEKSRKRRAPGIADEISRGRTPTQLIAHGLHTGYSATVENQHHV